MRTAPIPALYGTWAQPSYELRVRATTYLWGSAGITEDIKFTKPLLLHIRNDEFGEEITIGTQVAAGTQTTLGTLASGECVSIPIQDLSGVFATCALESTVACLIRDQA
jgi:hypothetical protein